MMSAKAMAALKNNHENFHYTIIGEGPLKDKMRNLCLELDLDKVVTFTETIGRNDVKTYMEQSDIFLIHSVTGSDGDMEGTPTVILEVGLLGKPVVATYHSGIPEIVDSGVSGFLTEEKDVEKTKDYMLDLIHDSEKRKKLGNALRKKVLTEYSEEENCSRFINTYKSISLNKSAINIR